MNENKFYKSLMEYFIARGLGAMVFQDNTSNHKYAMLYSELDLFPQIYINGNNSIGNVDMYIVEFNNPNDEDIVAEFSHCIYHFKLFLNEYYSSNNRGYILLRKNHKINSCYMLNTEDDIFYNILHKEDKHVNSNDDIYPYLNLNQTDWALYNVNLVTEAFNSISKLIKIIKSLGYQFSEIEDSLNINFDHLITGLTISDYKRKYLVLFPESNELIAELRISGKLNYIPIHITDFKNIDFFNIVNDLELTNRFLMLFEEDYL